MLKDGYDVCRACDAHYFREIDDVREHVWLPLRVHAHERQVVEAGGKLEEEPVVTISAADAEELPPLHFEVKRHASCCTECIVANLLEGFEFEDTFGYLCDRVVNGSASAQPQEVLRGAQAERIIKCFGKMSNFRLTAGSCGHNNIKESRTEMLAPS